MKTPDIYAAIVTSVVTCDDGDLELTVSPDLEGGLYPIYLSQGSPCPRVNSIIVIRKTPNKVKKLEWCCYYEVVS